MEKKSSLFFENISPALFWLTLVLVTLIHFIYLSVVPLSGDEAYHWEWSRHLDFSYYDHPPMVAWMIALSTFLWGTSLTTVRLPALFSMTLSFIFLYLLAREMFEDKRVSTLAGILALFFPIYTIGSVLVTTDPPLGLFYTLFIYSFYKAACRGKKAWWYVSGFALGGGMLCKFLAYMLAPAAFFFLLFSREHRKWFLRKEPYLALAVAAAVFSPVVFWNMTHDWSTFLFNFSRRHTGVLIGLDHIGEYFAAQMIAASPVIFWVGLGAIIWAGIRGIFRGDARLLFLFMFSALSLAFFGFVAAFERVSLHWTAMAYFTLLIAVSALAYTAVKYRRALRIAIALGLALALLFDIAIHLVPLAPHIIKYEWTYSKWPGGRISTKKLKEVFGWDEMGEAVSKTYKELSRERPAFIATPTYTMSGLVAFYTPGRPVVRWMGLGYEGVNGLNYRYWDDFPSLKGQNAVFAASVLSDGRKEMLKRAFERVEETELPVYHDGVLMRKFLIFRCYNFSGVNP
ncbi:MAG: glycosyltransferase family 39 protein [Deltaproteobacteria bacterium]|nr:glycosyltransferase family 39 protein [Deltaproteobacteria bacterium]